MSAPPESRRWLRFAVEDLHACRVLAGSPSVAPREVCATAQRSAEKALKAVVIARGARVPRTHDLRTIRTLAGADIACGATDPDLDELSDWATKGRYPGEWTEPGRPDAAHALAVAELVVAAATGALGDESAR